jgi:competence protein ComEC
MELFWHQAPLVRLLVPFALGIMTGVSSPISLPRYPLFLGTALLLIAILMVGSRIWTRRRTNHFFGILTSGCFFFLGLASALSDIEEVTAEIPEVDVYRGVVESDSAEKTKSHAVSIRLLSGVSDDRFIDLSDHRIIAYLEKTDVSPHLVPGSVIQFWVPPSVPRPPRHPKQFDFSHHLRNQGYSATVYLSSDSYSIENVKKFTVRGGFNSMRKTLMDKMKAGDVGRAEFGVISALILGNRDFIDRDLRQRFADAGAVHILAVSGLHVGIIYIFLLTLLRRVLRIRKGWIGLALILSILWGYAGITGFSPSVLRASTMFSFIALGKISGRFGNTYNMIAGSALVLLMLDPLLLTQPGFQLSYLAVLGISFYFPHFRAWFLPSSRLGDKLWSLVCVSLAAQLATFPISVYYFNQFPTYFLFTNAVVIPLTTVILYGGLVWTATMWVPWLGSVLASFTIGATRLLNQSVEFISGLPFSAMDGLYIHSYEVVLIYGLIVGLTHFLLKPGKARLRVVLLTCGILVLSFQARSWVNLERRELYFPNIWNNPSVVTIHGKSASVFARDTAEIREFLNRDLKSYLLSAGIKPDDCRISALPDSACRAERFILLGSVASAKEANLVWQPGSEEWIFRSDHEIGIVADRLDDMSTLDAYRTDGLTPFSIDQLPPMK